jgi:hypothetical protein
MLWGGLLMLVALLLLLGYLGRSVKSAAAFIGGVGWGTFIDELGKFITHDNDYFFQPTFALIYVSFVLLFVVWQALHRRRLTRAESLANALELMLEAVREDMDVEERRRALELLEQCDPLDPVTASFTRAIAQVELVQPRRPGPLYRARHAVRRFYGWLVQRSWFPTLLIAFFVVHSINALVQTTAALSQLAASLVLVGAALVVASMVLHPRARGVTRYSTRVALVVVLGGIIAAGALGRAELPALSFFQWAELISAIVPAVIVVYGVARLRESRLHAYRAFKTAVLIIIFVTQFFAFYRQQLIAVLGLLANIIVWVTLQTMIQRERRLDQSV